MKFMRANTFDPNTFNWSEKARRTIDLIRSAGKMDRLAEVVKEHFAYEPLPTEGQIDNLACDKYLLRRCGLDQDGHETKTFTVIFRVEGSINVEVDAGTAKEAAQEAYYELMTDGDTLIDIDREDIEKLKPVSYIDENGMTTDYPRRFKINEWYA